MVNSFGQETKRKTVVSVTLCGCELKRRSSNIIILRRLFLINAWLKSELVEMMMIIRHQSSDSHLNFVPCGCCIIQLEVFSLIEFIITRLVCLYYFGLVGWGGCRVLQFVMRLTDDGVDAGGGLQSQVELVFEITYTEE